MIIYGQSGKNLVFSDKILEVSAGENTVFVEFDNKQTRVGNYANREQCQFAIGMLGAAMQAGEYCFKFPATRDLEELMNTAKQHKGTINFRKISHGRS